MKLYWQAEIQVFKLTCYLMRCAAKKTADCRMFINQGTNKKEQL